MSTNTPPQTAAPKPSTSEKMVKIPAKKEYVDASNLIVGRLASLVAEKLLKGEEVVVANAEKAVFTGNPLPLIATWRSRHELRPKGNPETGPRFSRSPDRILKKIIEGMVPHRRERGREAMKRLRVYIGVPTHAKTHPFVSWEKAKNTKSKGVFSVQELSEAIGYTGLMK